MQKLIQMWNLNNIGYPFYDEVNRPEDCGFPGFKLNCNTDMPVISMNSTQKSTSLNIETLHILSLLQGKTTGKAYAQKER